MRKQITIICQECLTNFSKDKREYDRQMRNGRSHFFCSRGCSAMHGNREVPRSRTHLRKYRRTADDLSPFREFIRKSRLNLRGHRGNIDAEYLKSVWDEQGGVCALTGISLVLSTHSSDIRIQPSVDRIDSNLPYDKGNIQFVCLAINLGKSTLSNDQMIEFINMIRENDP